MAKQINWQAIEIEYRAGVLSVRAIARKYELTHTAINKKAKEKKWKRTIKHQNKALIEHKQDINKEVSVKNMETFEDIIDKFLIFADKTSAENATLAIEEFPKNATLEERIKLQALISKTKTQIIGKQSPFQKQVTNNINIQINYDKAADEEIERIKFELKDNITGLDDSILLAYKNEYARYLRLTDEVALEGEVILSEKGLPYQNPKLSALQSSRKSYIDIGKDLGLSPASRKRNDISVHKKEPENSIFDIASIVNNEDNLEI